MGKKNRGVEAQKARRRCNISSGAILVIFTAVVALISYILYKVLIGAHSVETLELSLPSPQKVGRYKMNVSTSYR